MECKWCFFHFDQPTVVTFWVTFANNNSDLSLPAIDQDHFHHSERSSFMWIQHGVWIWKLLHLLHPQHFGLWTVCEFELLYGVMNFKWQMTSSRFQICPSWHWFVVLAVSGVRYCGRRHQTQLCSHGATDPAVLLHYCWWGDVLCHRTGVLLLAGNFTLVLWRSRAQST